MSLTTAPFMTALIAAIKEARKEHAEHIKALPLNTDRTERYDREIRFIPSQDLPKKERDEIVKWGRSLGSDVITQVMNQFKDEVTINLHGHDLLQDEVTWVDYMEKRPHGRYTIERIARRLGFGFAMVILNLPEDTSKIDWHDEFGRLCSVFDYDTEDCSLIMLSDGTEECSQCGEDINPMFDMNTLKIRLAPTLESFDYKTDETVFNEVKDCVYSKGIGQYSATINVPSGKMVIGNRLVYVMGEELNDASDDFVEKRAGKYLVGAKVANIYETEYYETHNVLFLHGDNAIPHIFRNKKTGEISVKSEYTYDKNTGMDTENYSEDEEKLDELCMDLWASTAMCIDTFKMFCEKSGKDYQEMLSKLDATIVDVEPGKYKGDNYRYTKQFRENRLFVKINKVD